jgi:hypothetical protein
MRRLALIGLATALGLSTGCFVFDEIDKGQAIMKQHSGRHPEREHAESDAAEAEEAADEGPGLLARVKAYWDEKRSPSEPERSDDDHIVTCELGDDTTLTYHSDCLSRGGRIR